MDLAEYMKLAIDEAKLSLREGNNGFGAVIIKDKQIVAVAHDRENTAGDPTSHAEINAIKEATSKLSKNLSDCILVSTHEPCPMCATAVIWSGITEIAYGFSIKEALAQGRKRINLDCKELFNKAQANIIVHDGVLSDECSILYRKDVRSEIEKLRNADLELLASLNADSTDRRLNWFRENHKNFTFITDDLPLSGYKLLLARFGISADQAPIQSKTDNRIVFHSKNFCPTLEACKILGLDTRVICKRLNEDSTDKLAKQIDPRLCFSRNYEKLRPYADYCEEEITLEK